MLFELFSIIAPVFICALIGYIWVKQSQPFDIAFVTQLITNISAPCLIFTTFMDTNVDMTSLVTMLGAALICTLSFTLIACVILRFFNLNLRAFLPSQMFPNTGNMGLPLCLLAFGEEGLALALAYFTVNVVLNFSVGIAIASGNISFRALSRNPMIITVILTLFLVFNDITAPAWIYNTADLLAGITIPLMLIALGVSLSQFKIASIKRSFSLSALRLGMGFIVALVIAEILGLEGTARGVLIVQCSMPVAVFSYLFSVRYNQQPSDVAGTVVISTLMSFLTLPLLLWYVLP